MTRLTVADAHGAEEAAVLHTLASQDVAVALEFAVSPARAEASWTAADYEADVKSFASYLDFVVERVETDAATGAEISLDPKLESGFHGVKANLDWQGGSQGGARAHIDAD